MSTIPIGFTINFPLGSDTVPDDAPKGGLGSQVLPVAELDEDFGGIPEDGMQYLWTVR
jgi:hypothetical protein